MLIPKMFEATHKFCQNLFINFYTFVLSHLSAEKKFGLKTLKFQSEKHAAEYVNSGKSRKLKIVNGQVFCGTKLTDFSSCLVLGPLIFVFYIQYSHQGTYLKSRACISNLNLTLSWNKARRNKKSFCY